MNRFAIICVLVALPSSRAFAQADAGVPPPASSPTNPPATSPANPVTNSPAPAPEPPPAAPVAAEPTDADLAEIEAALGSDAKDNAAKAPVASGSSLASTVMPDISVVLDVAAAGFSRDTNLQTGDHDPTKSGFNFQALEMSIGKAVDPYFRFDANLAFGDNGAEVEEAYGTTLALPANLQVRIGKFLTRFGRINPMHPHAWDFMDQPFAIGRVFGGEGNRGVGVEASYLTPAPFFLELVGSATDASGEGSARSFFGASPDAVVKSPLDVQATFAAKEFFDLSANWSLATGQSVATGPNATADDKRTNVFGVDLYLKYRPITFGSNTIVALQSEWIHRRRQIPGRIATDTSGYASLFWRFAKRWGTAVRYEAGTGDADDLDPAWTSTRHRATVALTFWPTEFSRLRVQGSVDHPTWEAHPIWATFLGAEFSVGAHAAHKF